MTPAPRFVVRLLSIAGIVAATLLAPAASAEPQTRVFLNGTPAPVFFNDGDSFRVLGGEHQGSKARLSGFNTLESFGPVHQWGTWTAKELYVLAKMATLNARKGVWHCESDLSRDTYGRYLWWCKDLVVDQVRKGLAHAMTVTADPADPDVLAAQAEAIREKRGIWAHGVPDFVLTSTHSAAEGGGRDGKTYNRLVSSKDGHSEKWQHTDNYAECEKVCHSFKTLNDDDLEKLAKELLATTDADVQAVLDLDAKRELNKAGDGAGDLAAAKLAAAKLRMQNMINFGQPGWVVLDKLAEDATDDEKKANKDKSRALGNALQDVAANILDTATFTPASEEMGACVVHVDFRRRFGSGKASCLKK